MNFEPLFKSWILNVVMAVELAAGLVVILAVLQTAVRFLGLFFNIRQPADEHEHNKTELRLSLGRWLALALEFELAANILRTAVSPTWAELGKLAAIVALRTALNFFLEHEIRRAAVTAEKT